MLIKKYVLDLLIKKGVKILSKKYVLDLLIRKGLKIFNKKYILDLLIKKEEELYNSLNCDYSKEVKDKFNTYYQVSQAIIIIKYHLD